jgi:hypothetical protein
MQVTAWMHFISLSFDDLVTYSLSIIFHLDHLPSRSSSLATSSLSITFPLDHLPSRSPSLSITFPLDHLPSRSSSLSTSSRSTSFLTTSSLSIKEGRHPAALLSFEDHFADLRLALARQRQDAAAP